MNIVARLRFPGAEYLAAFLLTALMVLVRWAADPWLGDAFPLSTLFGGVALAVWVGGYRAAMIPMVLGYLACDYLFVQPRGEFGLRSAPQIIGLALYLLSCFFIVLFGEGMRRADRRARRAEAALRNRERGQRLLVEINDATRDVGDDGEVLQQVVDRVGRHFGASRCLYVEVEPGGTHAVVARDYCDGVDSFVGRHRMGAFSPALTAAYAAGRSVAIGEVRADPLTAGEPAARLEAAGIRALAGVPVMTDGRLVGIFGVQHREPRAWARDDIALIEQLAERTRLALEHARAREALRDSEARFREMADNAPVMVWVTDASGACVFLSRSWYEVTGMAPGSGLGYGWLEALHPEDREAARASFTESNRQRAGWRSEYRLRTASGEYRWMLDAAMPRLASDGRYLGYIGSVLDIHERRAMEQALREADRRKDEFLATLAHELRNPLAPIRSAVEIFRMLEPATSALHAPRDIIDRQVRQLTRLVDDLLDASRISQGKVHLRRERIDVRRALDDAIEGARPLIDRARHRLAVDVPAEPLEVDADPVRLTQIVLNLLNNAAKYTPPGGNITLALRREGGEAVIRVRDDGIGLTATQIQSLFRMFSQAAPATGRAQGGLGIGLALVRSFVEMHGGEVGVTSEGPDRGSEFVVRLPLA